MSKILKPETRFAPALKAARVQVGGVTPSLFARWLPILGVWGVGAGAAVLLFASDIPKFKSDILDRIPVVREYFVDKTPDSDKPLYVELS
ncbi:hypothetical protein P389DRAFT_196319 [Cystobasidium minutum MCA 4210]|uniref:uncharacterized protein n=1 Tax=Cystobasidium minutum MCA 4210 TaxID=1397322 RepID=UPI0034CE47E6|eukprot:jgi/Rhomi1/196319/gm1.4533_g